MLLTVLFVKFANFPTFILARASAIKFLVFANLNPNLEEIIHNVVKTFMKLLQSNFCTSTISLGFTREEGGANGLAMYCNQSFLVVSMIWFWYTDKLYIKIMWYPREID